MFHRMAISALWFISFLCLHELAWSVFGSPRILGLVIACMAAGLYYFDPFHLFRAAPPVELDVNMDRRLTPTEETSLAR